jgi:hypothetical protein
MLPGITVLKDNILALPTSDNLVTAVPDFVAVIANWTNQLQAGPDGTPGIFTFGNAAMSAILETLVPVDDNSWIPIFANAWQAGILAGVVAPSTVTNSVWIGSGTKDTETSASPASTITTISAAKALLISELANVVPDNTAPLALATAINDATQALIFTVIGLGPPPTFTPIPLTFNAQ